jgi:hypothetical protein
MTWESFYLICFAVGLLLTAISLFAGGGRLHAGHLHFSGHGHVAGPHPGPQLGTHHANAGNYDSGHGISRVNAFTVTAFLCWFGGVGYLLRTHGSFVASLVLLVATISGLAGAFLISWFLTSVLLTHEHILTAEETEMVGVVGRVTGPLRPGATGEILFSQLGTRRSTPARSEDGSPIDRDIEVIVMRYERGVAYVRRWDELTREHTESEG